DDRHHEYLKEDDALQPYPPHPHGDHDTEFILTFSSHHQVSSKHAETDHQVQHPQHDPAAEVVEFDVLNELRHQFLPVHRLVFLVPYLRSNIVHDPRCFVHITDHQGHGGQHAFRTIKPLCLRQAQVYQLVILLGNRKTQDPLHREQPGRGDTVITLPKQDKRITYTDVEVFGKALRHQRTVILGGQIAPCHKLVFHH